MVDEQLTLYPVVGWSFGVLPAGEAVLYLNWIPGVPGPRMTTEDVRAATKVHRYQMTAEQCDELAQGLLQCAERSRKDRNALRQ